MIFRGFRLGMRLQDILNYFGDISLEEAIEGFEIYEDLTLTFAWEAPDEIENFNKRGFFNYYPGWVYLDKNKFTEFSGIQQINISFPNGFCKNMQFSFDESLTWKNIEEFTEAISMISGLSGWIETNKENERVLNTTDLHVLARINTDLENIQKNCLSQFTYETTNEINSFVKSISNAL